MVGSLAGAANRLEGRLKVCIELRNYRRLTAIEWIFAAGRQPSIFIKLSHAQLLQISVGGAFGKSPDE
jgi:hypothetical protein